MTTTTGETVIAGRRARAGKNDDYRNRRALLLEHAARLFHTQGLTKTSLADIAAAAGLDRASIYYYFSNKEEIIAEVLREVLTENLTEVTTIAKGNLPPDQKLRRLIVTTMCLFDRHYPHLFVYVREDLEHLPISRELKRWFLRKTNDASRLWRDVVAEAVRTGTFATELPVDIVTQTIFGTIASAYRWYRPGGDRDPATLGEEIARLVIDGLRPRS